MAETLSEQVAALEMWKESAMQVLAEYDAAWEAAGKPGPLGGSKARALRDYAIAAESREKQAREARAAFVAGALWADREVPADTLNTPMAEAEARRRYPATGEEPTRYVPEPPRVVRLSGGRVMRWAHNEFGVAWLCRNGAELPPLHFFRNSCGELMYDYRVIAETPEDFTTLERLVQEVCAYLASRPTASGEG